MNDFDKIPSNFAAPQFVLMTYVAMSTKVRATLQNRSAGTNDRGATAVEYGLIVGLIAAVIFAVVAVLGAETTNSMQAPVTEFENV